MHPRTAAKPTIPCNRLRDGSFAYRQIPTLLECYDDAWAKYVGSLQPCGTHQMVYFNNTLVLLSWASHYKAHIYDRDILERRISSGICTEVIGGMSVLKFNRYSVIMIPGQVVSQ